MIHTLITAISTNLPMPHISLGAITGLLIAAGTFLWLKRGSRSGALMLLALAIGLAALTWEVLEGQNPAPLDWGSLESLLVDPQFFKKRRTQPDPLGLTVKGRFWGQGGKFLGTQFCLDGEDAPRGIAALGAQGNSPYVIPKAAVEAFPEQQERQATAATPVGE
jgi:hypothetical protein